MEKKRAEKNMMEKNKNTKQKKQAQTRCAWCGEDPQYVAYHDDEWGVPVRDSKDLFAKLILDGAQAGLAWITILRKRVAYYEAFDGLDPEKMARFSDKKIEKILQNPGIVRNRLKVQSAVKNAKAYMALQKQGVDFSEFLWSFVDGKTRQNTWNNSKQMPAVTKEAEAMSKALKKAGFSFVGPTIVYAFMQAVGMVNDHLVTCPQHKKCLKN